MPNVEVIQSDLSQNIQSFADFLILEEIDRLAGFHIQNIENVFVFIFQRENFILEALTVTFVAGHLDVVEKVHFEADESHAVTFLAGALGVETEKGGRGAGRRGYFLTDEIENSNISDRRGAR